jgi:putative sugar O-methyltransferase
MALTKYGRFLTIRHAGKTKTATMSATQQPLEKLELSKVMNTVLQSMINELSRGNQSYLPSKFWQTLNQKNQEQIEGDGLANFKQTVAQNYFTWVIGRGTDQYRWLKEQMGFWAWPGICLGAGKHDPKSRLSQQQQRELTIFTRMLWKVAERADKEGLLKSLEEPMEGDPFRLYWKNKLISQDLANSILEYYAIREHFAPAPEDRVTICELGAGYGRNAFVFLKALPKCRYIVVDIPPALYIAQHYLTRVFPDRKAFTFRPFEDFGKVADEFQAADMAFLLPHQAEMLPKKSINLFLNISSLQEMTLEQIQTYFRLIDRLTAGYFYSKQWKVSQNPQDNIVVRQEDYPVPGSWRQLFHRQAKVQVAFFEAMYAIPASPGA